VECCAKDPGADHVTFQRCRPHNPLVVNHTAAFLRQCLSNIRGADQGRQYLVNHVQHPDGVWAAENFTACPI
jgi:hypothetical protein